MSLQDKLDAFRAEFETKKAPPEVVAVFHKSTAELIATGQATRALKAGDRAPAFRLPRVRRCHRRLRGASGQGATGRHLLPWCVVPLLQHGSASD